MPHVGTPGRRSVGLLPTYASALLVTPVLAAPASSHFDTTGNYTHDFVGGDAA